MTTCEGQRDLLKLLVQKEGFRTEQAESGSEALKKAGAVAPDLIVLDLMLPGLGGYEVLRQLQSDGLGPRAGGLGQDDGRQDHRRSQAGVQREGFRGQAARAGGLRQQAARPAQDAQAHRGLTPGKGKPSIKRCESEEQIREVSSLD